MKNSELLQIVIVLPEELILLLTTHTLKLVNHVASDVKLVQSLLKTVTVVQELEIQFQLVHVLTEPLMTMLTLYVQLVDVTV